MTPALTAALESALAPVKLSTDNIRRSMRCESAIARLIFCSPITGLRRTGIAIDKAKVLVQEIMELPGLNLTGIFTFKGAIYEFSSTRNLKAAGREEGEMLVALQKEISNLGDFELSGGSTPTGLYTAEVEGIDEIRPGTYVFNDAMQVAYGRCGLNDCALKVVYTVISHQEDGRMVIDGGSKSISTDAAPNTEPYNFDGYGICCEDRYAFLERLSEEHGVIRLAPGAKKYKIGDIISFIPNHVCPTLNLYDEVYIGNMKEQKVLKVDARGQLK